jgi:hypothetical protein
MTAKAAGLGNTIRDWLYENKGGGLTVTQVMDAVNTLRDLSGENKTDDGAVRRAMETLATRGYVTKDFDAKPVRYKWVSPGAPRDYVPYTQRMTIAKMDPQKKTRLHDRLRQEMGNITGTIPADDITEVKTDPGPPPATIITRPNGQEYRVRQIADKPDIELLKTLREHRIWPLLYGPPGTGKTSWVDATFQQDMVLFPGDENTTVDDMFGTLVPNGEGSWDWVDGPVTYAMKAGKVLFLDDVTLINGRVLGALYPAMDGRDEIVIKTHMVDTGPDGEPWPDGLKHPEVVRAQPGFFIVGAHNPGTNGAMLSDALSSRFKIQIQVDSDLDLAQAAGVHPDIMKVARTLHTNVTEKYITWAPQLREIFQAAEIAEVTGSIEVALANLAGLAPEDDRDYVVQKIRQTIGNPIEPLKIGKQL